MRLRESLAIALLIALAAARLPAAEVVDQQNDVGMSATADSAGPFSQEIAQTFTVGVEGTLSRFEAQLNRAFGAGGTVILTVYNTSGGVPNASLGTATLPWNAIPTGTYAYSAFDVSSLAIPVHANDVFAFGIKSSGDVLFLLRSTFNLDTYAGGETKWRALSSPPGPWMSFSPSHDSGFKTFVLEAAAGLPGDFNDDGKVDGADYVTWREHLGDSTESALNGHGDNQNGVDAADYTLWRTHFATGGATSATTSESVPEPASLLLLVACAIRFALAPRRSRLASTCDNPH
jgi:hypothetical protein